MTASTFITRQEEQLARDLAKVEAIALASVQRMGELDPYDDVPDFDALPITGAPAPPWGGAVAPCTDAANAQRIQHHLGDKLLFVDGIGWHVWGPPWRHDRLGALKLAQGISRVIANEAADLARWVAQANAEEMPHRQKMMDQRFRWAAQSESKQRIDACMSLAESWLTCKAEALDANPMLLGLPGGVLELDTGTHREHRHADLITKVAGADFNPTAPAPVWTEFLTQIMDGDQELISMLHQLAGYSLCGSRGEHILPILWGSGANGKSTFLGALQTVLGDYATSAAPGLLIRQNGTEHPTALADLQGQRLIVVSESGENGRLNEEQIKAMTGGDRIRARRMRENFFEFTPTHLLFLQTNHKPKVTGNDEGIWRRLRLIPFNVTVPPERRDPHLPEKLRAEAAGILAWAYRGLLDYRKAGRLPSPEKVTAATAEYRTDSDVVGAFLDECTTTGDGFSCSMDALFRAYADWCDNNGERRPEKRAFGERLKEKGFTPFKSGAERKRKGLMLNQAERDRLRQRGGNNYD